TIRLMLPIVYQSLLPKMSHLVVIEILLLQVWALFENDNLESGSRKLLGNHAARGTGADHHEIHLCLRIKLWSLNVHSRLCRCLFSLRQLRSEEHTSELQSLTNL